MSAFIIPADFKYVASSLVLVPVFAVYVALTVDKARKVADVQLPALFASDADAAKDPLKHRFNCTQKSAMNFQEHAPNFIIAALVSGLSFPRSTAAGICVWVIGRYFYHTGYSSGKPADRMNGRFGSFTHIVTMGAAIASAVMMLFF